MPHARLAALAVAALTVAALTASGCVSFSMFQGPEGHEPGELSIGAGAATFPEAADTADDATFPFLPEASLRYGLGHGFDLGVKFAGFPPFGTTYGDLRWQLLDAPVPVTAGLGASGSASSSGAAMATTVGEPTAGAAARAARPRSTAAHTVRPRSSRWRVFPCGPWRPGNRHTRAAHPTGETDAPAMPARKQCPYVGSAGTLATPLFGAVSASVLPTPRMP